MRRPDLANWWVDRIADTKPNRVWLTTDEYLELGVALGLRAGDLASLLGIPIILVDQFDTKKFRRSIRQR